MRMKLLVLNYTRLKPVIVVCGQHECLFNLGLKINYEKTTIYRIGSLANSDAKMYSTKQYVWDDLPICTLGILVDTDPMQMSQLNMAPLTDKTNNVLKLWKHRPLTLSGRVLVVNTLVESLFVYRFSVMSVVQEEVLKELKNSIIDFIWAGKQPKYQQLRCFQKTKVVCD